MEEGPLAKVPKGGAFLQVEREGAYLRRICYLLQEVLAGDLTRGKKKKKNLSSDRAKEGGE